MSNFISENDSMFMDDLHTLAYLIKSTTCFSSFDLVTSLYNLKESYQELVYARKSNRNRAESFSGGEYGKIFLECDISNERDIEIRVNVQRKWVKGEMLRYKKEIERQLCMINGILESSQMQESDVARETREILSRHNPDTSWEFPMREAV